MKTNLNEFDGFFRSLLFIIAVIVAVMTGQWIWLIPGAVLFATAVLTWCPLYAMFGFKTKLQPLIKQTVAINKMPKTSTNFISVFLN